MHKALIACLVLIAVAVAAYFLVGGQLVNAPSEPSQPSAETPSPASRENTSPAGAPAASPAPTGSAREEAEPAEESPAVDPEFHALISYTEQGYEPSTITVQKGQTVRFVNNHPSQETWPASAIHPTHGIYPEKSAKDCLGSSFDSCRGLKAGEFWEFTFTHAGEWRFHDHLHASKTGVIIVK